jgi:hypothetical protein
MRPRCGAVLALGWVSGLILLPLVQSCTGEPRTLYEKQIELGEIIEPRLREILPPDAATYAENYQYCLHWSGEEAYDEARGEEIARGIEESCTGLEAARDSLRLRYPSGSTVDSALRRVIAQIDSNSYDYVWDDPHYKSIVLNRYYEAWGQHTPRRIDELIAQRHALSDTASEASRQMVKFMSTVETRYLTEIMGNIGRLHPETAKEVRAACIRWERDTGERVDRTRRSHKTTRY